MISSLIVDDVPVARDRLVRLLAEIDDVSVVGTARDSAEAIELMRREKPQLIFLDIQMPGGDGFSLLEQMGPDGDYAPRVIVVTAHDAYAVRAFEIRAVDYLLKPVWGERLGEAVARARDQMQSKALFQATNSPSTRTNESKRFAIRSREGIEFLAIDDIDWIECARNYLCLHVGASTHIHREPLHDLERRLHPEKFARIHRSYIVNVARIVRLVPVVAGDYVAVLSGGNRLPVSRTYRSNLFSILGLGDLLNKSLSACG